MDTYPPLHRAVLDEDVTVLKRFFHSTNVDLLTCQSLQYTALHLSCKSNTKTEMFDLLLSYGADNDKKNVRGYSPVHCLCMNTHLEFQPVLLKLMLKNILTLGADIDAVTFLGSTPLHIAAARKNALMIQNLLKEGADPNIKSNRKDTALDVFL